MRTSRSDKNSCRVAVSDSGRQDFGTGIDGIFVFCLRQRLQSDERIQFIFISQSVHPGASASLPIQCTPSDPSTLVTGHPQTFGSLVGLTYYQWYWGWLNPTCILNI